MQTSSYGVIATLFSASAAVAAEGPEFTVIDNDRDGYVSREEARAAPQVLEIFASVDANRDGRLSPAEYVEALKQLG